VRILNDAYNANPASMTAALHTLASLPAAGRENRRARDMRELGDASLQSHRGHRPIGRPKNVAPDMLICVRQRIAAFIASEAVTIRIGPVIE